MDENYLEYANAVYHEYRVVFNTSGSPYNVPAGSKVDMTAVAEHYKRKHQRMDEARVARMEKENGSVYD